MTASIDLFWSFRSPYSYMATPMALQTVKDFDVDINLRVVEPKALRTPEFFSPESEQRIRYILMDWPRRCEMLGMPHAWPIPDPIVQDMDALKIAPKEEQIYIYRLMHLGVEAQRRGKGLEFIYEVSHIVWGGVKGWDKHEILAAAVARAGLDLDELDEAININPQSYADEIEDNHQKLADLPHWGVPTFGYNGEPFFGVDRVDSLHFQLTKDGLKNT